MSHSNIPRRLYYGNSYLGYASTIYIPDALDSVRHIPENSMKVNDTQV